MFRSLSVECANSLQSICGGFTYKSFSHLVCFILGSFGMVTRCSCLKNSALAPSLTLHADLEVVVESWESRNSSNSLNCPRLFWVAVEVDTIDCQWQDYNINIVNHNHNDSEHNKKTIESSVLKYAVYISPFQSPSFLPLKHPNRTPQYPAFIYSRAISSMCITTLQHLTTTFTSSESNKKADQNVHIEAFKSASALRGTSLLGTSTTEESVLKGFLHARCSFMS